MSRSALREARHALHHATTFHTWCDAAETIDHLVGFDAWRADDDSAHYDAATVQQEIRQFRDLRTQPIEKGEGVLPRLQESLGMLLPDVLQPRLFTIAYTGTKHLVSDYLKEIEETVAWFVDTPFPDMTPAAKRHALRDVHRSVGRSALLLSGGAGLGFFHLGVVGALHEQDLLPPLICGSSTGAMIAAGVCARTDTEIADLCSDPAAAMRLDGIRTLGPRSAVAQGVLFDSHHLAKVLTTNVGDLTFAEALARTGRNLNISVSPERGERGVRLLNAMNTPHVYLVSAVLASSALPGLYPSVVLQCREPGGQTRPFGRAERWIDGSIQGDVPSQELSRLYNVSHSIVSQANPHVAPFVRHRGKEGLLPVAAGVTTATVRTQSAYALDIARRVVPNRTLREWTKRAYHLFEQDYRGDIEIHVPPTPRLMSRVLSNPTPKTLEEFVLAGRRATWPKVEMVRAQTRATRALERGLEALDQRTEPRNLVEAG